MHHHQRANLYFHSDDGHDDVFDSSQLRSNFSEICLSPASRWTKSERRLALPPPVSTRTQTFTVAVPSGVNSVMVQRCSAANGSVELDTNNIVWAGTKFTLANEGLAQSVGNASSVLQISNGRVGVSVAASEAVMVLFGAQGDGSAGGMSSSNCSGSGTAAATSTGGGGTRATAAANGASSSATPHRNAAARVLDIRPAALMYSVIFCAMLAWLGI